MEKIYDPTNYPATEPLDLDKYFKECQTEFNTTHCPSENVFEDALEILKEEFSLPFTHADITRLEALCTIDKLKVNNENQALPIENIPRDYCLETHPITQEARALETVRIKEEFNAMADELQVELKTVEFGQDDSQLDPDSMKDIQPGSTFICTVLIYTPFNTLNKARLTSDNIKQQYEIEVLSLNTLLDLANVISCVSDSFIIKEVPDMQIKFSDFRNAKEKYPSRCFFIENVFYNDMSHPNAIDYSEVIKNWAAEKGIGEFRSRSIEGVTFSSLKPRLGYGYVYIHQGNCEHVLCFSDARLVKYDDCLISKRYPRIITMRRHTNYFCFICSQNYASWLVIDSDRLPVRKAFFCSKCCESYMFLDGKKIGHFQLFPYDVEAPSKMGEESSSEESD